MSETIEKVMTGSPLHTNWKQKNLSRNLHLKHKLVVRNRNLKMLDLYQSFVHTIWRESVEESKKQSVQIVEQSPDSLLYTFWLLASCDNTLAKESEISFDGLVKAYNLLHITDIGKKHICCMRHVAEWQTMWQTISTCLYMIYE